MDKEPEFILTQEKDHKTIMIWPWLAQLVRVPSQFAKVVGSIPGQSTYKKNSEPILIKITTDPRDS